MRVIAPSRVVFILICLTLTPLLALGREPCHVGKPGSLAGQAARGFYWSECTASHNAGKIALRLWESCAFGDINHFDLADCVTGETPFYWGAEYPKKSRVCYLSLGAINVGGVLYGDTLVSESEYL